MHIGIAIGLFIVSYLIQLLLCFKAKSTQKKLIPFYFGLAFAFLGFMFYAEIFGNMSMGMLGNGHSFIAVIIWIAALIMYVAISLAAITYGIVKAIVRRKSGETHKKVSAEDEYIFLTEKEAVWAGTFSDVLRQNEILFYTKDVLGAAIRMRVGYAAEVVRFYVHHTHYQKAQELEAVLFSEQHDEEGGVR